MDETVKLTQICPQPNNDQTKSTDSTVHEVFVVVEDENSKNALLILQLDPEGNKGSPLGAMPFLNRPSVVVSCSGSIFCLGDVDWSGLVDEFDLVTRKYRTNSGLVKPVRSTASAASNHEVIVSGGEDMNYKSVAICCVYAKATNSWMYLTQLRQARRRHRMCWMPDGRVFVIGGFSNEVLSSVEMLERAWILAPRKEASAKWQNVAPMKTGRSSFGCCVAESRIMVAGGWTAGGVSSSVETFKPPTATNTGQWTSLTNLASPVRWGFLVPSTDGLLLIDRDGGGMQLGRRKAQVASFEWDPWTWERRSTVSLCRGLVSLPSIVVSQR